MPLQIGLLQPLGRAVDLMDGPDYRHPLKTERVGVTPTLRDKKTGSRIREQVLRVNGHAADEEERRPAVQRKGHDGGEWKAGMQSRIRRQRTDALLFEQS